MTLSIQFNLRPYKTLPVTVIESKANTNTQLVLTALVLLTGSKYDMQR